MSKTIYFYFDDSGVFHRNNESGYFVYGGYCFVNNAEQEDAKRKYISAENKIREATGIQGELKASKLENKHRRALYTVLRNYETVSCSVRICDIEDFILDNEKAKRRIKDFLISECVAQKTEQLISRGVIERDEETTVIINIDQQVESTRGHYDIHDAVRERLQFGIRSFDYLHPGVPVIKSDVTVRFLYCDSKKVSLIRACDIIANWIWTLLRENQNEKISKMRKHLHISYPW